MRKLRCGFGPRSLALSAARIGVIGFAVVASGCASSRQPSYVNGPMAQVVPAPIPVRSERVEIEDDGKPAQVPGRRIRPEEDDPSQPWSSNYGRGVTPKPIKLPPRLIDATAPAARDSRRVQVSDADAETIMARAIAAHEMRRQ